MKRKLFALVAAFILTASLFTFTGCSSREEVLRVRTWTDYTDQEYVEEAFPEYYYRQTGKTVRVEFSDFTNNEDLYMEIETNKEDYDLICPSDYAVERLIANKLLLPLDKGIVTGYDEALDTGILEKMRVFDPELKYSFPYAWGTLGIMYNTGKDVIEDDMRSWGALWNEDVEGDYFNKIYMKDSVRDAFAVANIYNHREELLRLADEYGYASAQYQALLNSMFATPDTDTVKAVKETLIRQREVFFKYESEDGKSELEADGDEAYMGLFWSCDAGLVMPENTALRYSIPEEGANFYVDSFVIPKYARNVDAAQHFLQFLTDTETAYTNMIASGATCAVTEANERYREELEEDLPEDTEEELSYKRNFIDSVMFPDADTLARCGVMRDYGSMNAKVTNMFIGVRTAGVKRRRQQ